MDTSGYNGLIGFSGATCLVFSTHAPPPPPPPPPNLSLSLPSPHSALGPSFARSFDDEVQTTRLKRPRALPRHKLVKQPAPTLAEIADPSYIHPVEVSLLGSSRIPYVSTAGSLSPMQVVHLNKGHLPRNTILRNSKLGITHGLHFTYEELARSPPFMCWFCIAAGMCRLVRPQMSTIPRIRPRPNEYIVADEVALLSPSFEGFIGYLFIACLCTDMEYAYGYKSVSEFAVLLRRHFSLMDPSNFPRHFPTRWIGCDHLNVHLGQALRDLQDSLSPRFEVVVTAAEDKERSRAEPRIQRVKILHRVALLQCRQ